MENKNTNTNSVLALDETRILSTIVDAMLDAESKLAKADAEQWQRILGVSCRKIRDNGSTDTLCSAAC